MAPSKVCIIGQRKWTFKEEKERKGKKKTKLIVLSCTQDLQTSSNKTQEIEKQENQKF